MTCHSTGRLPIGIIGLGSDWLSARIRMPSPPQNRTTFTTSSPSEDLELREGDHQSPTPLAYVLKLGADLLAQVPRHDQHVVGAGLGEGLDGMDRDVRPRQVLPVLVR